MKAAIRKVLAATGLLGPVIEIKTRFHPVRRRLDADYREFRQRMLPVFGKRPVAKGGPSTLLIVAIHDFVPTAKTEGFLARALEERGYRTVILLNRPMPIMERIYRLFGLRDYVYLRDFQAGPGKASRHEAEVDAFFAGDPGFEAILGYEHRGYEVGKHALSWVVRSFHSGFPDFQDPKVIRMLRDTFVLALRTARAAEMLLDRIRPDLVLFNERGYAPYGEIFDACLQRGINTVQFVGAHLNEAMHFKRYTLATRSNHPISLSARTWEKVREIPLSPADEERFIAEHYDNYRLGKWYERQRVQTGKAITSKDETYKMLGLNPGKKTAVVFSHVLWDATFFYGQGIFKDYAEWLVETVKAACANDKLNWLVKLHPANVWRLEADGYTGELVEHVLIREHIGKLPHHVRLIDPDTKVNTFSLFEITDYCLTVRGTIGMEMPIFGVPVITAGTGRYSELGFTVNSTTREEYLGRLARLEESPRLTPAQVTLARKHAYAVFKLRPLIFETFKMLYPTDKSVPAYLKPGISIGIDSWRGLDGATDLRAFADWAVDVNQADYLAPYLPQASDTSAGSAAAPAGGIQAAVPAGQA